MDDASYSVTVKGMEKENFSVLRDKKWPKMICNQLGTLHFRSKLSSIVFLKRFCVKNSSTCFVFGIILNSLPSISCTNKGI